MSSGSWSLWTMMFVSRIETEYMHVKDRETFITAKKQGAALVRVEEFKYLEQPRKATDKRGKEESQGREE